MLARDILALSEELQQQLSASRCGQSRRVWTRQSNTYHRVVSSSTWCTTLCICLQSPCVCLVSCTLCSDIGKLSQCTVTRMDHRWNIDIKASLNIQDDVVQKLEIRRLSYFGHVCRLDPHQLPYICLHGRVEGRRCRGRPRKRWLDCVKENCNDHDISLEEAFHSANDRERWRSTLKLSRRMTVLSRQ